MDVKASIRDFMGKNIAATIAEDDDIFKLGLVDSLFGLRLVTFVESEFGIVAEREDLEISNFCSIAAVAKFVVGKLAAGSARGQSDVTV